MSSEAFHNAIEQIIEDTTGVSFGWVCGIEKAADAILAMPEMQALLAKDAENVQLRAENERLRAENDAYRQVYIDEAEFLEAFANWDGTRENLPLGWKWEQWDKKNEQ